MRNELKFESDLPYEILNLSRVNPWDFNDARNRYLNVADELRDAMTHNPYLKVFIANGYYDLATPYLATRSTIEHMTLAPELRDHVTLGYYDSGHMVYINHPSLVALRKDLGDFYRAALNP